MQKSWDPWTAAEKGSLRTTAGSVLVLRVSHVSGPLILISIGAPTGPKGENGNSMWSLSLCLPSLPPFGQKKLLLILLHAQDAR